MKREDLNKKGLCRLPKGASQRGLDFPQSLAWNLSSCPDRQVLGAVGSSDPYNFTLVVLV